LSYKSSYLIVLVVQHITHADSKITIKMTQPDGAFSLSVREIDASNSNKMIYTISFTDPKGKSKTCKRYFNRK
jgi:hypothetical protein